MNGPGRQPSVFGVLLLSVVAGTSVGAWAQNKPSVTDAQVEANVLRALAGAPELSTQNIQSTSVYGTVTLSGNVHDEALRTRAENLVARADGVKKVVDELTLGDTPAVAQNDGGPAVAQESPSNRGQVLQSDGTYAAGAPPTSASTGSYGDGSTPPPPDGAGNAQSTGQPAYAGNQNQAYQGYPPAGSSAPYDGGSPNGPPNGSPNGPPNNGGQAPYGNGGSNPPYGPSGPNGSPYGPQANGQAPYNQRPYGQVPPNGYGQNGYGQPYGPGGGQQAGLAVTVPSGAALQVRIDRGIDSNHIQPGTAFTGTLMTDVTAGGLIAIPRGASVQGTVVDAKKAGVLKGEGELALQVNTVILGGQTFPVNTLVWQREGRDKTLRTVNSALGLGALGAVFGGLAGGGAGAAIGAGVGGALGVGSSASSPSGRVIVPPESVLTFSLAQPLAVKTVSQAEMQRLSYAAGSGPGQRQVVVRRSYYGPYGPYGYPYGAYYYGR